MLRINLFIIMIITLAIFLYELSYYIILYNYVIFLFFLIIIILLLFGVKNN